MEGVKYSTNVEFFLNIIFVLFFQVRSTDFRAEVESGLFKALFNQEDIINMPIPPLNRSSIE